ncbi:uncharacterized protein KY384_008476 [Bacidia gigantensis]|uniref:uncharacterized protein n=1 Tax=Bacidia gigantensis TaxID=2732470 RepID=UPI001D04D798|nr:uncharacterized protein KY384_008476 [Bacidia gigantensis]KAG8527047.1 hypothetical protein KY384_008476 [Bacidia gigantensis]
MLLTADDFPYGHLLDQTAFFRKYSLMMQIISAEILIEKPEPSQAPNPPILRLASTSDGAYVIAITGEDKCIRVLKLAENGTLELFSERMMPKRPCAVALTRNECTLLCADKFGDVYAMPLLGKAFEAPIHLEDNDGVLLPKNIDDKSQPFAPSANSSTVHTKRNLESLRQQQRVTNRKLQKKTTSFEHQLALGHVSLLTDLACASLQSSNGVLRNYILTSDRDEHIRISRGLPQAHIIEGYCLGHTHFVSRMCLIPQKPRMLLSGGGDDFLILWDWPSGQIFQRIDIRGYVEQLKGPDLNSATDQQMGSSRLQIDTDEGDSNIAISSITFLEYDGNNKSPFCGEFFVTAEGFPAIFHFRMNAAETIEYWTTHRTEGNVISTVALPNSEGLLFSIDSLHIPFSTTIVSDRSDQNLQAYTGIVWSSLSSSPPQKALNTAQKLRLSLDACASEHDLVEQKNVAKGKSLQELLYGLEGLRKRGSDDLHQSESKYNLGLDRISTSISDFHTLGKT